MTLVRTPGRSGAKHGLYWHNDDRYPVQFKVEHGKGSCNTACYGTFCYRLRDRTGYGTEPTFPSRFNLLIIPMFLVGTLQAIMPPTRVAVCISGKPGPLVEASHQRHWNAALAPLRRDPGVLLLDIFLHLHGSMHARPALEAAAAALQARSLRTYEQVVHTVAVERYPPKDGLHDRSSAPLSRYFAERHSSVRPVPCMPMQCLEVDGMECIATGYDQSIKWRGCLRDIRTQERANGWSYDYVLRARPDLEFGHALPDVAQWRRLRSDVVMPMIVTRCTSGAVQRLAANVSRDVCFVDDTLALMPRHAADAYFGAPASVLVRRSPLAHSSYVAPRVHQASQLSMRAASPETQGSDILATGAGCGRSAASSMLCGGSI